MRKKSLLVSLEATQPSLIELTVREHVQIDRVVPIPGGRIAECYGRPVPPGTSRVVLAAGKFCFRTLSNASLCVVTGGVIAIAHPNVKDPTPDPPGQVSDGDHPSAPVPVRGDAPDGELPTLTIVGSAVV